jgi:TfoX N-terminal domain
VIGRARTLADQAMIGAPPGNRGSAPRTWLPAGRPRQWVLARLADMAYDTELADRIRFLIGTGPGLTEKKMFGGLAFLIGGNMAISASGQGGALIRVDPADCRALTETTTATIAVMGGREMRGWLRVRSDDLETDEQLTEWVNRAVSYARSLPPKR